MRIIRARVSIPYLLVGFGVCISVFGPSIKSNAGQEQFSPTVRIAVSSLEIIKTEMLSPYVIQVTMKNCYSKGITAVVASIGDYKVTRIDYIFAEAESRQQLPPGASDYFSYTVDCKEEENIVITAVLFSDMTREGDLKQIRDVLDKRLGVKIQLARFIPHLENLRKVEHNRAQAEIQRARQVAENLPIQTDSNSPMSTALEFGLQHGRAFIQFYLRESNNILEKEKNPDPSDINHTSEYWRKRFPEHLLKVEKDFKSVVSRL